MAIDREDLHRDRGALRDGSDGGQRQKGVREVRHLHAWALTAERPLLTLHATVDEGKALGGVVTHIKRVLTEEFGIDHSTIQVEHGPCPDE